MCMGSKTVVYSEEWGGKHGSVTMEFVCGMNVGVLEAALNSDEFGCFI